MYRIGPLAGHGKFRATVLPDLAVDPFRTPYSALQPQSPKVLARSSISPRKFLVQVSRELGCVVAVQRASQFCTVGTIDTSSGHDVYYYNMHHTSTIVTIMLRLTVETLLHNRETKKTEQGKAPRRAKVCSCSGPGELWPTRKQTLRPRTCTASVGCGSRHVGSPRHLLLFR